MQLYLKRTLAGIAVASVATLGLVGISQAVEAKPAPVKPPAVHNQEAKPAIAPGSMDHASPTLAPRGTTKLQQVDPSGKPASSAITPKVGYNSNVDFSTVYNYCYGNLVYTTVHNLSSVTQYFEVLLYANGGTRTLYSSVAPGGYAYPTWYGVTGTYYAYMYVLSGSSYNYDEYELSNNTCSVSYSLTKSIYTGYLYATIKNNGTAYAYVELDELAPYPTYGTYTGDHWYYPAAGGGTAAQYVYVGVGLRYGVDIDVAGSLYYASHYTGTY